jgi:uncharacterized repeat protein (TIGR01451 family)
VTGFSSSAANLSEALTVTYGGKTATFDVSVVAPTPVLESISGVAAINGTVTITLAAVPTVAPVAGDFTATSAIGGGTASALPLTGFTYDSNVTVTYNFASIAQTASDQSVVVAVTLGGIATAAPAFTVTAIPGATSSDDAITSFILGVPGEIDTISSGAVAVTVPSGTNVASLTPTIAVSVGATVSPTTAQDFTSPVTYTVTAADTTTTQPYIVTVTVSAPQLSADATLSALTVGGTAVTGFAPATLTYSVTLPAGTTDVPTVIATANDAGATAVVTPAASLLGATNVLVTAASGATQTYTVNFTVAPAPLATDDTLSALTASAGTLSPDFVSSTITYSDVLPYGTSAAPTVTATTTDTNATDTITQATSPTGSATVAVLAQDASTTQTYTINFSVAANTVVVSSGGGGGGGGGSAQANIGITSAVDNGSPTTGSTIHYTLTVSATGPSTSFGIMANDILPAGLTFVSASSSEGSYNSSTGAWTIGSLNVGQTATLTIAATVTASTGTAITNTATVSESSAVINSNAANDSSSVTVNVGGTSTGQVLGASTTGGGNVGQVLGASTTNTVALLQELQNLEQQLITLEFKANSCSLTFNTNLSKGMTNSEVQNLQKVLNYTSLTQVASTGPGSPNNESTYFGSATKNAVIAFQNIFANQILTPNGLTSGNGYVGATTRSVLNGLCSQ